MNNIERAARQKQALEYLVRASEAVIGDKPESITAALLYAAGAVNHLAVLNGESGCKRALDVVRELHKAQ